MGEVNNFITKAQGPQYAMGKERQTRKFLALQVKAYNTLWASEPSDHKQEDTDSQDEWVKNLTETSQTQKNFLPKDSASPSLHNSCL